MHSGVVLHKHAAWLFAGQHNGSQTKEVGFAAVVHVRVFLVHGFARSNICCALVHLPYTMTTKKLTSATTHTNTHTHTNRANLTPQPSSHMPSTTEGPQLSIIPAGSANQNIMNSLLRTTSEEWLCVRPTSENTAMERKTGRFRTQSSKQVAAYTHS